MATSAPRRRGESRTDLRAAQSRFNAAREHFERLWLVEGLSFDRLLKLQQQVWLESANHQKGETSC
ncbi:MAG: hypothetical protein GX613_04210 [Chloroflexi bacterium]|nr:hypothetical protein [Chloroflexota bacterium]